jgi:hypothetical protein
MRASANHTQKVFQAMRAWSGKGPSGLGDHDELDQDKHGIQDPRPAAIFGEAEAGDALPVRWANSSRMHDLGQFVIME